MKHSAILFSGLLIFTAMSVSAEVPAHRQYGGWESGKIGGGGYLQSVSICKADPQRVYMATDVGGVYRSDDGGATWRMLHGALPAGEGTTQVRGVLAHPGKKDTVLVAVGSAWDREHGVYKSEDGGKTFRLVLKGRYEGNGNHRGDGLVLVGHPSAPEVVFTAPLGKGLHRSDDFGKTWKYLNLECVDATGIVLDRASMNRIWVNAAPRDGEFLAHDGTTKKFSAGMFCTEDGGKTWTRFDAAERPIEMVQDPKNPKLLHASFRAAPQLRFSEDYGRTWQPYPDTATLPAPGGARDDGTYAALAVGPDFILAGGHGGHFYRLLCGTTTWEKIEPQIIEEGDWYAALTEPIERHFGSALGFVAVFPGDPDKWLFTDWYACYISPDAGRTWNLAIDGVEMTVVHCVAQDPGGIVHAGMADIGYFRSIDGARTFGAWGRHSGISNNIKHLSICRKSPNVLYAVGPQTWKWHANQTFRSRDGGASWQRPAQRGLPNLADDGGARCNTIAVHPENPDEVYLVVSGAVSESQSGTAAGGVYKSVNGGDDWTWFGEGLPAGDALFRADIWVSGPELAVSPDGSLVAMSNDKGRCFIRPAGAAQWQEIALPAASNCIVADATAPTRFYAALKDAGLYRTDNGGKSWVNVFGDFAAYVAVDPANGDTLAVSTNNGDVWASADGGATWINVTEGLPYRAYRNVLSIAGDTLVVGTGGSGIFRRNRPLGRTRNVIKTNEKVFPIEATGAGGSAASAKPLIRNGDMSDKLEGWSLGGGDAAKRSMAFDAAVYKSAPGALRFDIAGTSSHGSQRLDGKPAGKALRVAAQLRAEGNLKQVQLYAMTFDAGWKQLSWKTLAFVTKRGEWVRAEATFTPEAGAANVLLGVLADGTGKVWLDDVAASEASGAEESGAPPPPVAARKAVAPLAQQIAPTDAHIFYGGRWDMRDPEGPRAAWSGSAVTVRFRGTRLNVRLKETNANRYEIFIDGKRADTLVPEKGAHRYRVADGLANAEHTATLAMRTEAFFGVGQILGFELDAGGALLAARPPARFIEVIGDSITCGYGNEAPDQHHKFNAETENAASAYGFLAALELGAEYSGVSWSGKKLWPDNSIVDLYRRTLPQDNSSVWDFAAARQPDVVVINLGTNDFGPGNPDEAGWVGAYIAFVKQIRANYPRARIYCAVGPMLSDPWSKSKNALTTIRGYLRRVVAESGDPNIAFLEFKMQDGSTGFGADWHPSNRTHARMAKTLADAIRKDLGW